MKAVLATCTDDMFPPGAAKTGGSQHAACLPECMPPCPNLNLGASRTLHDYVMLLCCGRMLKFVRGLRISASLPPFSLYDFMASYTFYTICMHALRILWLCIKHRFCHILRSCVRNEHLDNAQ